MSADQDHVFQDDDDQRQIADMMVDIANADRKVLARVRVGVSTYDDLVYLAGRLNYKLDKLEG